jgi:hypothetical protein
VLAISTLGLPHRINSNVRVSFRGAGRARFRLQHTGTRDGKPDPLGWCEVSAVSNGALACPADAIDIRTLEDRGSDADLLRMAAGPAAHGGRAGGVISFFDVSPKLF